ncbi:hypothetical protein Y032_0298g1755 [Ancylostoma ceylanicum]|uniref:Uncharacterized protein n=1 Tax=Ancylostoma ceylanicum TaxID=53326 RepID=A0A016S4M1_9BILA|nr:hypothetical protein Y032_0298g1755 [Ancylostoma ceylanicum]
MAQMKGVVIAKIEQDIMNDRGAAIAFVQGSRGEIVQKGNKDITGHRMLPQERSQASLKKGSEQGLSVKDSSLCSGLGIIICAWLGKQF